MTFDAAQRAGVVGMVPHDPPVRPDSYTPAQALDDLILMTGGMKKRSEQYRAEAQAEDQTDEADKHMRVYCVLKEIERLGNAVKDRAARSARL